MSTAQVQLYDDCDLDWQRVSPSLRTARLVASGITFAVLLVVIGLAGLRFGPWVWLAAAALALIFLWELWLIPRQVSAISYAELDNELVIRKGRMLRELSAVPYGRLQYVDLKSGPLERRFGLASLTIYTASPSTSGLIPGLPAGAAEALRERLIARGEATRAGL